MNDSKDDNPEIKSVSDVSEESNPITEEPKIEILSEEEENFKHKYLRVRADVENIQRRMREERANIRSNTLVGFIKELLPFIDNLDRATAAAQDSDSELVKGLKMNRTMLDKILSDNNVKTINNEGLFNANLHEAVTSIENNEKPNNSISAVLECGYVLGERVIRYSKVQVTTGGAEAAEEESAN